jgi:hypothetical protein
MEHHGETPPEGLWNAIEREMDRRAEALSRRRRRMFRSIGSGAAAAVAALLLLVDFGGRTGDPAAMVAVDPTSAGEYNTGTPERVVGPVVDTVVNHVAETPRTFTGTIAGTTPETIIEAIPETVPEAPPVVAPETVPEEAPEPEPRRENSAEPRRERPAYEQYFAVEAPATARPRKSRGRDKWQTGLYASNGAVTGSRSDMTFDRRKDAPDMYSAFTGSGSHSPSDALASSSNTAPGSVNRSVFNNVKHSLPVTFGVSVGHGVGERWSLAGGVTYTRLATTFKTSTGLYSGSYEQVLHYIGIPLDVRFDLWRSPGGLSVYLSAGGQAAGSVAGRVTASGAVPSGPGGSMREGSVTDPRVQWSVRGSAGVGYDFTPTVGLYAEPGVDYHFDNGSSVVTVWKDRPLNFGLRLGLRLSL